MPVVPEEQEAQQPQAANNSPGAAQEFLLKGERVIPIGRFHFLVESWTEPGEWHAVDLEEDTCSCRGFECTQSCRHLLSLKEFLNEQTS